jgi:hypothetical protein
MKTLKIIFTTMFILSVLASVSFAFSGVKKPQKLDDLFGDANVMYYDGSKGIGINHIAYWTMNADQFGFTEEEEVKERAKIDKMRPNGISSELYPPWDYEPIPGWEVTGILVGGKKKNSEFRRVQCTAY